MIGRAGRIAGEHDGLAHSGGLQCLDGLPGVGLDDIRDDDMAGVGAADGHMHNGAGAAAGNVRNPKIIHEPVIAHGHIHAVHRCQNAVAAALLDVFHPAAVDLFAIGPLQTFADGV